MVSVNYKYIAARERDRECRITYLKVFMKKSSLFGRKYRTRTGSISARTLI
jgi:hypothetical protein